LDNLYIKFFKKNLFKVESKILLTLLSMALMFIIDRLSKIKMDAHLLCMDIKFIHEKIMTPSLH